MTKILAIDPGQIQSGFLIWDGKTILEKGIWDNRQLMDHLDYDIIENQFKNQDINYWVIEKMAGMGMAIGAHVFETAEWVGIFRHTIGLDYVTRLSRHQVKMHLCGNMRANSSNILTALVDRFDPLREYGKYGKGTKAKPGPLYGMSSHLYSALALAVTFWDQRIVEAKPQ